MVNWKELGKDVLKTGGTAVGAYVIGEMFKDATPTYIAEAVDVAKDLAVGLTLRKGIQDINHDHLNGSDIMDKVVDAGTFGMLGTEMLDNMADSQGLRDLTNYFGIYTNDTLDALKGILDEYGNKIRGASSLAYLLKDRIADAFN